MVELCATTLKSQLMVPTNNEAKMPKDVGAIKPVEFCYMDSTSYVRKKKKDRLQPKYTQSLINYLRHMQVEEPTFFYVVQLDANGLITNFF